MQYTVSGNLNVRYAAPDRRIIPIIVQTCIPQN